MTSYDSTAQMLSGLFLLVILMTLKKAIINYNYNYINDFAKKIFLENLYNL